MGKRKGTEKGGACAPAKKAKGDASKEDEAKLLAIFLQYHMDERQDITFEVAAVDLDCHKSNNRWRAVWKSIKEKGLIDSATTGKGFQITQNGIASASTPEYREFMKEKNFVPAINEEHQERLKKRCKQKKSSAIFDLLLKHGSLSRYELAGLLGEKDRSHSFSYSLQELTKLKNFVEADPNSTGKGKKFRLSDKAFLKPADRPEPEKLDEEVLAKAIEDNAAPRSASNKNSKKAKKKGKSKEGQDAEVDGDDEQADSTPKTSVKRGEKKKDKSKEVKKEAFDGGDDDSGSKVTIKQEKKEGKSKEDKVKVEIDGGNEREDSGSKTVVDKKEKDVKTKEEKDTAEVDGGDEHEDSSSNPSVKKEIASE